MTLSQFEELEEFARFGTRLDDATKARLTRGASVRAALRQPERDPISAVEQLAVLIAAMEGVFDGLAETAAVAAMAEVRIAAGNELDELAMRIADNQQLQQDDREGIVEMAYRASGIERGENGANA